MLVCREIISVRRNVWPRMLFSREKHLCLEKYLIRDYFQCCKSSSFAGILRQGLFRNLEKHLCLKESFVRDYLRCKKSSLFARISGQGYFGVEEIILQGLKINIRITLTARKSSASLDISSQVCIVCHIQSHPEFACPH